MKTRTKVAGKYQRRYSSGIQMYRERMNLVDVPANTTVTILQAKPKDTLCQLPKRLNEWIVLIPNANLPKIRTGGKKEAKQTVTV